MIRYMVRRKQRGQAIVIIAGALLALVALVALAVDGGNAYAQRRNAQNAVDGAAVAGITKMNEFFLANRFCNPNTTPCTPMVHEITTFQNGQIRAAMLGALQAASNNSNSIDTVSVTFSGTMDLRYLDTNGSLYGQPVGEGLNAVPFASGNGANSYGAAGVWAATTSTAGTYFARIIGINSVTADAHAGARIGSASRIAPLPQVANASGNLQDPILWPLTLITDTQYMVFNTQVSTTLWSLTVGSGASNWADLKFNNAATTDADCSINLNNLNDFTCFMFRGFTPTDSGTPFEGYAEQGLAHDPGAMVPNHLDVPLGSDGITADSTGIWVKGTPRTVANRFRNKSSIQNAAIYKWPVLIPVSDRVVTVGGQKYYHIVDAVAFRMGSQQCCGGPPNNTIPRNDLKGQFMGYGWAAGRATYGTRLDRAVTDGQTVLQLGP